MSNSNKVVVLAVGPVLGRELMPEIQRAMRKLTGDWGPAGSGQIAAGSAATVSRGPASVETICRRVALAAEITFEATLRMDSIATAKVARCLGTMVTAQSLAQALSAPGVLIGDRDIWWARAREVSGVG